MLDADVEVDVAVVVVVGPGAGLRREEQLVDAGREGDVEEPAAALVAQQRAGLPAARRQPGAAQDEDVEIAVVVVVGLHHVEAADEPVEPGFLGAFGERAVAVVVEVAGSARARRRW